MFDRTTAQIPKYRLRKPSGRGVVRLNGRDILLGTHGAPESKERYRQVIAEWLAKNRQLAARREFVAAPHTLSVAELLLAYLNHAASYYVKNGQPTREQNNIRDAMRSISPPYGIFIRPNLNRACSRDFFRFQINSRA